MGSRDCIGVPCTMDVCVWAHRTAGLHGALWLCVRVLSVYFIIPLIKSFPRLRQRSHHQTNCMCAPRSRCRLAQPSSTDAVSAPYEQDLNEGRILMLNTTASPSIRVRRGRANQARGSHGPSGRGQCQATSQQVWVYVPCRRGNTRSIFKSLS